MPFGLVVYYLKHIQKSKSVNGSPFCLLSLSPYERERTQVCCVGGNLYQTFMKRQTDIINLSPPSVVSMLGCGGRLHSDHS